MQREDDILCPIQPLCIHHLRSIYETQRSCISFQLLFNSLRLQMYIVILFYAIAVQQLKHFGCLSVCYFIEAIII
jgi:hypothetical protein